MIKVSTEDTVNILGRDYSTEESSDFISNMTAETIKQISEFFEQTPKLTIKHDFKCKSCGYDHSIKLEGIQDFFM